MSLKVRPITAADKPAIMRILHNTPEFKPVEVVIAEELIDACLEDPSGSGYYILVAESDSSVVGYVCYGPTPLTDGSWDIYWIAVDPKAQNKGIGGTLLNAAEDKIKEARGRLAFIETSSLPEYEKTRRFHHSHGYELVCQIADFYTIGDDKLILEKRLS